MHLTHTPIIIFVQLRRGNLVSHHLLRAYRAALLAVLLVRLCCYSPIMRILSWTVQQFSIEDSNAAMPLFRWNLLYRPGIGHALYLPCWSCWQVQCAESSG